MREYLVAALLLTTGFMAGRSHNEATNPSPPFIIVNRVSQFEEQIRELEEALDRVCIVE